jgi:putative proteasome-type protease
MTFCLGMKVKDGLVGIADTRVTSGNECITARKVSVFQGDGWSFFLMTSGLRSARDKALTYFEEVIEKADGMPETRMFKIANLLAAQIRKVSDEDKLPLEESGFQFNIHALVGGQLECDREHRLYLIYPQGNWVEVGPGTPYHILGASGFGKPVLDRTLKFEDTMRFALKVGCLAFDSTRISAADVGFPLDVVLYVRDSFEIVSHRFEQQDLAPASNWWQERLRQSVRELPLEWMEPMLEKLPQQLLHVLRLPTCEESAG